MRCELLVSDVAGTVVSDDGVVLTAFESALHQTDPEGFALHRESWMTIAQLTMGQSKKEVFTRILGSESLASEATEAFEASYRANLDQVLPLPGVEKLLRDCSNSGVTVYLTTGFSRGTLDAVVEHCGWGTLISGTVTPEEAGAGRPSPAMIERAMSEAGVLAPEGVVVVGDTESDVKAGKAAQAGLVVGVLTGAHSRQTLEDAGADRVFPSIVSLRSILALSEST